MSTSYTIELEARDDFGSSTSRRLRREGQVPVVVYGAGKDNAHYVTNHNSLMHNLEIESFHSAIIDIKENGKTQGAIVREVQMHPHKLQVLHVDLQRIKATEVITLRIPLHFEGDDSAPGVKIGGGIFSRLIVDVEIQCLPKDLPEYLSVDVSELELNQSVHTSDIILPEGVELTALMHDGDDFAIASIAPPRISAEVEDMEVDEFGELGVEETDEEQSEDDSED